MKMYAESAVQLGKIKEVSNLHEYVCPSTLDVFLYVVSYCPRHLDVGADINADDHNVAWDPLMWAHDSADSAVVALDLLGGNVSLQVDAILGEDGSKVGKQSVAAWWKMRAERAGSPLSVGWNRYVFSLL